jgi:hypothetical protein
MVLTITKLVTSYQSVAYVTQLELSKIISYRFLDLVSLYN